MVMMKRLYPHNAISLPHRDVLRIGLKFNCLLRYTVIGFAVLWMALIIHQYVAVDRLSLSSSAAAVVTTMMEHQSAPGAKALQKQSQEEKRRQQEQQDQLQKQKDSTAEQVKPAPRQVPIRGNVPKLEQNQRIKQSEKLQAGSEGTFNHVPIFWYQKPPRASRVDCIGHDDSLSPNGRRPAWQSRSCRFLNLCFDTSKMEYVFLTDDGGETSRVKNNHTHSIALGGMNPRWDIGHGFDRGGWKMEWFPTLTKASAFSSFYQLPESVIFVPFHSLAGHNVGHLMWDDFYPIFRLLQSFGLLERNQIQLLLLRHVLPHPLYANCDIRRNKRIQCTNNFVKFLPMLGMDPMTFSTNKRINVTVASKIPNNGAEPTLICAKTAVAGLGLLTDHGLHDHGWENRSKSAERDVWVPHNVGKGRIFYDFRQFLLQHALPSALTLSSVLLQQKMLRRISFSLLSSKDWDRRVDFLKQQSALKSALSTQQHKDVQINSYALWNMSLTEQLEVTTASHIFISACGGASMTSTFLSRGASLILFYNPTGGLDFESFSPNQQPARLDWDLLNNAGHLRVHWLPLTTMDNSNDLQLFVHLVLHELEVLNYL